MQEEITKYKYHSTNQFRNVVKTINDQAKFQGIDPEGNAIIDVTAIAPTLEYEGTVKLHGTNSSIIIHSPTLITFNSKSKTLGYLDRGEFTLLSDNAEFAQSMSRRTSQVNEIVHQAKLLCLGKVGQITYPIKISGEWCGQGIQKSVGISYLEKKSFFIFGIKIADKGWYSCDGLFPDLSEFGIYNIYDFPTKKITIDFNNPVFSQNELVAFTEEVENECPVSKQLGITESLLGEGLVFKPVEEEYGLSSGTWFKVKGEKHSVSKTKSVAAVCPEKLRSVQDFIEYSVTENRLDQGIGEIGLDQKLIGKFIGWVNSDINKEEGDVLEESNLTMKDVGKFTANKARQYYLGKLNSL